ncbi:MAG: threonine aldolase family protein [Planctomycetaceae bacterium]
MIDLRSDTVTRPVAQMRQAMADAEVGDAVIDTDPTTDRLERLTADILGKEAALFMPSGSMTNQIAVRVHCDRGSEFICEAGCHIYNYEQAAFAQLSGVVAQTVAGTHGVLRAEQLRHLIRPENDHMVRTRLVCLENTHNRAGGRIQPQTEVEAICRWAHEHGLQTHLDGARLWNAAVATGAPEAELAKPFDSVSVCFSKGLGAPVGSALAGSREFIKEARRARKLFGGAMRQSGVIAAGALFALNHHRKRLAEDHQHAQMIGKAVEACESLKVIGGTIDTNIVVVAIADAWGTAKQFVELLADNGLSCFAIGPQSIRLVTHLDLSTSDIEQACEILCRAASVSPNAIATP